MKESDLIRKEVHKEVEQQLDTGTVEEKIKKNILSQEVNELLHHMYIHYSINKFVEMERPPDQEVEEIAEYERALRQNYSIQETNFLMQGADTEKKINLQDKHKVKDQKATKK